MKPGQSEQLSGTSQAVAGRPSLGTNAATLDHVVEQEEPEDDAGDKEANAIREAGPAEDESSDFSEDLGAAEMA